MRVREDFHLIQKVFKVKHSNTAQLVESCAVVVFVRYTKNTVFGSIV